MTVPLSMAMLIKSTTILVASSMSTPRHDDIKYSHAYGDHDHSREQWRLALRRADLQHNHAYAEHDHSGSRPYSITRHANGKHDHAHVEHGHFKNKPYFCQSMLIANTAVLIVSTAIPRCL